MTYKLAQGVNTLNVFRLENVLRKRFTFPIDDLGKEIDRFFLQQSKMRVTRKMEISSIVLIIRQWIKWLI